MSQAETDRDTDLRQDLEALRIDRGAAPRKRRRRPLRWLVLAAAVVRRRHRLARALTPRAIQVSVAAAERAAPGQVKTVPVLSGSGYIVTGDRYISVGVRVAGRIERYFVEEGQTVKADAPLVQLDDRDYRASVERAEASLAVAKANRDLAESELARGRKLRARRGDLPAGAGRAGEQGARGAGERLRDRGAARRRRASTSTTPCCARRATASCSPS